MKTDLAADGNGVTIRWSGGCGTFAARGDLGGGTLTMEYCPGDADDTDSDNWEAVSGISLTSPDQVNFSLGDGKVRAVLTGSTAPDFAYDFLPFLGRQSNWG